MFSRQSVHKQRARFSQALQIHKRDEHICDQKRYIEHRRFNESFLTHANTCPFYPLFAWLDVNAKVHEGKAAEMLWDGCIILSIEARKIREFVHHDAANGKTSEEQWFFDPFAPDVVAIRGSNFMADAETVAWELLPMEVIKGEQQCWAFNPNALFHGISGIVQPVSGVQLRSTACVPGTESGRIRFYTYVVRE
jgi:ornithine decarboxylase